jgi:diguanylate cyclase (GGDEF)-like protein
VWAVKEKGIGYIKIYFKTDFTFKLMIMLRKDLVELKERLNKAIDSLSDMEKQKIITKYIDEKLLLKDNNNYKMWFYVSFGLLIFMSFLLYEYLRHKKKASLDPLTKVLNRGAIEDILKKKLKDSNGSVILFDIDYFKKINDNYGHNKGDEVLKELAKIVKSTLRKTDYIGRWGGEEFVILLPEVEFEDALKVAEKIRNKIEKSNIGGLNVTVSLGVSSFKKGDNLQLVIKKADDALYSAKENGRNQVKGIK